MTTQIVSLSALFAGVLGTTALAQSGQQSSPSAAGAEHKVLVGCVKQGPDQTARATPVYTLESALEKLPTSPAPEGSGPVVPDERRYVLSFEAPVNLAAHVNHRVEVTGDVLAPEKTPSRTPAQPQARGTAPETFHVSSVKMVATTCQ